MSAGVLVPPFDTVNKYNNPVLMVNSICMFSFVGETSINFALLGGHLAVWDFESPFDCGRAMAGIYEQLGVIEDGHK